MKRIGLIAGLAITLMGCSTPQPLTEKQLQDITAPSCSTKAECDTMWQQSQVWIAQHSAWKLQTVTDTIIQTYGPGDSTDVAYTITRIPLGGGINSISMRAACGNLFGCVPRRPSEEIIDFNNSLRALK